MSLRRYSVVFAIVLLGVCPKARAAPLAHAWSQIFGDGSQQVGSSTAIDDAGNVIITGYFEGTVDFGGGPLPSAGGEDICVAKFDVDGNHLWSQRFGDSLSQYGSTIAFDGSGNIVVTGSFQGTADFGGGVLTSAGLYDAFVVKFDTNGNHLWSRRFGDGSNQRGQGIAVDGSGNIIIAAFFDGTVDFGGGPLTSAGGWDIYVAKFDVNGNHLWSQRFGDSSEESIYTTTVDGSGNVIIAGSFQGTVDFGGGTLVSAGDKNIFVAKFDAAGNHLWSQCFGDASILQHPWSVAVDGLGNILVTGNFYGTVDFGGGALTSAGGTDIFVVKFDAGGNHLWSQRFGDSNIYQVAQGVAVDGSENVVLTGYYRGTVDFGGGALTSAGLYDTFVVKFDADGNHLWSEHFGDAADQYALSIAADSGGTVIATGYTYGTVDFGGGSLTSAGQADIYIAKFAPVPPVHNITQAIDYTTISAAIAAANPNDVIKVDAGSYPEHIVLNVAGLQLIGSGSGTCTLDGTGFSTTNNFVDITDDNVTMQGFTVDGGLPQYTVWPPLKPYYAINSGRSGLVFMDVIATRVGKSGFNMNGASNTSFTNCAAVNNGGAGWFCLDTYDITFNGVTTSNNQWTGVAIATWGRYHPLGTNGIVFAGTNSLGEATSTSTNKQGGIQLEQGNYFDKANPALISFSSNPADGADVTYLSADVQWSLNGPQDDGDPVTSDGYKRVRLYATQADAIDAGLTPDTSLHIPGPGHFLSAGRYVRDEIAANTVARITPCAPCISIPVGFDRVDATAARAISVTFQISPELELCGAGIVEETGAGSWIDGFTNDTFLMIDNGGGSFTVDVALLGTPCGSTVGGAVLTVEVASTLGGASGTGTIEVTGLDLRDCDNAPLLAQAQPSTTVIIDTTSPAAIVDLAATQLKTGNGTVGTTTIDLSWTAPTEPDVNGIVVYRKGFGFYPEYDDGGGSVPATPADPIAAAADGWVVAATLPAGSNGYADVPGTRDFWYYVAFVDDDCNVSGVSNQTGGTLDYHLGDVTDGISLGSGDNAVATMDLSALGSGYGTVDGDPTYGNFLDVGPTTGFSVDALPTTDNKVQFEDLMIFAINFGQVSKGSPAPTPAARNEITLKMFPRGNDAVSVEIHMAGDGTLQGVHVPLRWNESVLRPTSMLEGSLMSKQNRTTMVLSPLPGEVDAAVFGTEPGISGEGLLAVVDFQVIGHGEFGIAPGEIVARDAQNHEQSVNALVASGEIPNALPARTVLHPNYPNPFNPKTTVSFTLAKAGHVLLRIYALDGRQVATLADEDMTTGLHEMQWTGMDESGRSVSSGTYLVRLVAPDVSSSQRITLLK